MSKHDDDTFIELRGIVKQYGGVTALDGVDFRVKTCEAICGMVRFEGASA